MKNTTTIAIVGGGFCGMMTAVHLMKTQIPLKIVVINDDHPFAKGVAYNAHTEKYLLNVRAVNMSAFDEAPQHFLDWLHTQEKYKDIAKNILANVYVPRKIYGNYLSSIWQQALENKNQLTKIELVQQKATDIVQQENKYSIILNNDRTVQADMIVLATGNTAPRQLDVNNKAFFNSKNYFANPWKKCCVENVADAEKYIDRW